MSKNVLFGNYHVAEVDFEQWNAVFEQHHTRVFPHEQHSQSLEPLLNKTEKTALESLQSNLSSALKWHFLLFEGDKPIGWHFGLQRSELEYFMANTGILPEYQNRGIYSAFLKFIISQATHAGFQYLTSIHHSDNNAVLVPKLKAGFLIQSFGYLIQTMLLEGNHGPMIQLVYPAKDEYRKFLGFQMGLPNTSQ